MAQQQLAEALGNPAQEVLISAENPAGMAGIHVASLFERTADKAQNYDTRLMAIKCKDYAHGSSGELTYLPLAIEISRVLVNGVRKGSGSEHFMVIDKADICAQPGQYKY